MENKPRYAIVRVDDRCPVEEEENIYLIDRIKMFPCFNDKRLSCKKCNYGDTKEQLVAKVEQAIRRNVKNGVCLYTENNSIHTTDNRFFWNWVAKFIVEFLGVE